MAAIKDVSSREHLTAIATTESFIIYIIEGVRKKKISLTQLKFADAKLNEALTKLPEQLRHQLQIIFTPHSQAYNFGMDKDFIAFEWLAYGWLRW
jgi:hypothetical protein